jgi:DNA-directed RNA polymerase subunit RPC12/RpoP
VDARLVDLKIRTQPGIAAATSEANLLAGEGPKSRSRGRLTVILVIGMGLMLLLMVLLGTWLAVRQRRVLQTSEVTKTSEVWSAACSSCGKKFKARAALGGKKVKCPHCGKAVLVPETRTG